jgi:hypothetical protein
MRDLACCRSVRLLRAVCVAGLLTALTNPLRGQIEQSAIPRDLVVAALRQFAETMNIEGNPTIIVGSVPAALVSKMSTPAGGRVLGSIVWGGRTDVLGEAPGQIDSVLTWFGRDLVAHGFTPASSQFEGSGGFRSARVGPATGYCKDGLTVTLHVRDAPANAFGVEYRVQADQGAGSCDVISAGYDPSDHSGSYPLLYNPPTAQLSYRCVSMNANRGSMATETYFTTSALPLQLLQHYGKQLDSAGWKRDVLAIPAVGEWVRPDSAGNEIRSVLRVFPGTARAPDCRKIQLEIITNRR